MLYIVGAVAGAAGYLMASQIISSPQSQLAGASAAVMCLIGATAVFAPAQKLRVAFIGNIPLWVMAMVGVLCMLTTSVAILGAHAGGMLAGGVFGIVMINKRRRVSRLARQAISKREKHNILIRKVRDSGFASLSPHERLQLFDMSNEYRKH